MKIACFANKNGKCKALTSCLCKKSECPFYKTKQQLKDEKLKVANRLSSLDRLTQKCIADTYRGGNTDWFEGGELV